MTTVEERQAARLRRNALYEREPKDWTDDDLAWVLTERYAPSTIPPCPVCGGALSIAAAGGGEPTRWACSLTEDDPDRSGYVRTKAGRGKGEFDRDGHYSRSQYVDRRQGGDDIVMELLRRFVTRAEIRGVIGGEVPPIASGAAS